jgi:serine/threonine protein kinase
MNTDTMNLCPNCFSFRYTGTSCPECGFEMSEKKENHSILPPGVMLGKRYLIGRELGVGGFGITYKAYDMLYREVCAIKEYAPSGLAVRAVNSNDMQVASAQKAERYHHGMQRFIEEAQMLKRLEQEPAVVEVKECFTENQTAYFVMEFLDGQNLKHLVQNSGGHIRSEDITHIIMEIGKVMGVIHRKTGILHRDISPENIFILKDGRVKILDFGSARQQVMDEKQEFSVEFKRGFAPPEQYTRVGQQGTYTDVYALACTYYYTLTGVKIPDAMERLGGKTYVPLFQARKDISRRVSDAVDHALVLDYHSRTQTMEEFIRELQPGYRTASSVQQRDKHQLAAYLEVMTGAHAGAKWKIPSNTRIILGRSLKQSNIIIDNNPMISKMHCCIIYDQKNNELLLEDLSRNGVFINGKRLNKNEIYHCGTKVEFALVNRNCIARVEVIYE